MYRPCLYETAWGDFRGGEGGRDRGKSGEIVRTSDEIYLTEREATDKGTYVWYGDPIRRGCAPCKCTHCQEVGVETVLSFFLPLFFVLFPCWDGRTIDGFALVGILVIFAVPERERGGGGGGTAVVVV